MWKSDARVPWHLASEDARKSAATSKHLSVTLLQLKHHKAAVKQTLSFQQWEAENVKGNN